MPRPSFAARALLAGLLVGCSTASTGSMGTDGGTASGDTGDVGGGGGGGGLPGDQYCTGATRPTCRSNQVATCGVCIAPPARRTALARTNCDDTQRREYCRTGDVGQPNLSCFQPGSYPRAGASERVTLWGAVRVFGNGGDSQHVRVTVHRVAADGMPGEMIGSAVSDLMHPANGMEDVYSPSRDRVLFTRRIGGYHIENVPTESDLVVIVEGNPSDETARGLWSHRVYDYNIYLRNAEVNAEMPPAGVPGARRVRFNPRVISNSDWSAIPATASLTSGITPGRGALAGEVHDCDDIRLANATVESNPVRAWDGPVVYFSENDTNPLPDLSREQRGTSLLGTYALLDVTPGPIAVAAVGYNASNQVVHLGSYRARVFPDSVTIVTFRGLRPWQAPSP